MIKANSNTTDTLYTISVGPFVFDITEASWLSPKAAGYALERLWAIVSGGSLYEGKPFISFSASSAKSAYQLIALEKKPTLWISLRDVLPEGMTLPIDTDSLPALFYAESEPGQPPVEYSSVGILHFNIDLVSTTFFMLSRWEETVTPNRDEKGRFPGWASVAGRQGFLTRPIVDEWALVLRMWLQTLVPEWRPDPGQFRVLLSHDVDVPLKYRSVPALLKPVIKAIIRHQSLSEAIRLFQIGLRSLISWKQDPYYLALLKLMQMSENYRLHSAYYFKTSDKGSFDSGYDLNREPYASILHEIQQREHEVGFHPGYSTFKNPITLRQEKERLDKILGYSHYGGRQHHLLFQVPDTWRAWNDLGLLYDSTLTYADCVGFRCGTCHPYPVYDIETDCPLELIEIPLIVMERTLFEEKYQSASPEEGFQQIITLAERCQTVGGVFTLLWHNSTFDGQHTVWNKVYDQLIPVLASMASSKIAK